MTLPWFKARRTKILAGAVVVAVAAWLIIPALTNVNAAEITSGEETFPLPGVQKNMPEDEELHGLLVMRDNYFLDRRLTGTKQLSVEEAGVLHVKAAKQAAQMPALSSPFAPWTGQGPNPIVQVGRTTGTFEAVSGRIGALAIQPGTGRLILGAAQGGIWTYDAVGRVWVPRTDDQPSLAIGALAIAPSASNIVYAGTGEGALSGDSYFGNGVMKSIDGGVTWTNVSGNAFQGVSTMGLVVDPLNANHLYIAVGRGRAGIRRVSPPNPTTFGIYESNDGGVNWILRKGTNNPSRSPTDIDIDPQTPTTLYASFWGDAMYKSVNGGVTWTPIMTGLPADADFSAGATRFSIGLSHPSGHPAVLYVGFDYVDTAGDGHPGSVWKSTNEGASWSALPGGSGIDEVTDYCGSQCFYDNVVEVDPSDSSIVYVAGQFNYDIGSGGIYRSTDGGATWKSLGYDMHPDYHAIAIQSDHPANVIVGNDGGVWYSTNRGGRPNPADALSAVDWQNLNGTVNPGNTALIHSTNLQITQFTSIATNPTTPLRLWGGSQDNGTERRSVANARWLDVASGDGGQVLVDPTDTYVFGTYFGISPYRFSDGPPGAGFFSNQSITRGIDLSDRAEFYIPWVMNQANPNQLFLGTYRLYRTNNAETPDAGDVLWAPISPDLTSGCTGAAPNGARGCFISAIGVADGGDAVYTGADDGYVYLSEDAVTSPSPTWHRVDHGILPPRPVTQFAVDRSNYRTAYAAFAGFDAGSPGRNGHVFKTTNAGLTWTNVTGNLPDNPVNSIILDPSNPNTLYAGTDVGVFMTTNGGVTWGLLASGMPVVSSWQISFDPSHRTLAAGTHGRGAFTTTDPTNVPAFVVSKSDTGVPVGPGSNVNYTITVRNIGNANATGVSISDPIPARTTFVSASGSGALNNGNAVWTGLNVPAGGSTSVNLTVKIDSNLPTSMHAVVNDHIVVGSAQGVGTSSSPHNTPIAPPHGLLISPSSQTDGTRVGQSLTYHVNLTNVGFLADSYSLAVAGNSFTTTVFDTTCTSPLSTTGSVPSGGSVDVCVRVAVPSVADGTTDHATITATSVADITVSASAAINTIAVTLDTLLVDNDNNAPDVKSYYQAALTATGTSFSLWDLSADKNLPQNYMNAHHTIVWFTGASYPGPITPYEARLKNYLDGGGRLFMSGWDILDQAAGTTTFVHDYLHINWDGLETQNDKPTAHVNGVAGSLTNGIGAVTLDLSVLGGAQFSDRLTLLGPATPIFTDDSAATDGLSVIDGGYKVVFLAFPFEEYGTTAAQKADLMTRVLGFFGP